MKQLGRKLVSWASILEPTTEAQARAASTMPFLYPHLALMPDAHLGKGATVGSVIPTERAIMPAAVGVDIGCGMDAVLTPFTRGDLVGSGPLGDLRTAIERAVPLSAGSYNAAVTDDRTRERVEQLEKAAEAARFDPDQYAGTWRRQLGSLGSGNHFIEVTADEQDRVWLFLHSGSRGVGNKIAMHHIKVAQRIAQKWHIALPDRDLAYLVEDSEEFWAYVRQMRWAQEFARLNRAEMMDRVADCVGEHTGTPVERLQEISCHHNYTEQEEHFGRTVWLSRKGAIDASEGRWGLIPGSMGDASYVVVGKGNRMSLNSAPHGAGRAYSRAAARRTFTMDDLAERMAGIEWSGSTEFLDEHPSAYKPIDQVMADAADLVEVRHTLRQVVNVKGD
ncbi:RtcB family protein [Thalassiella azotivora]